MRAMRQRNWRAVFADHQFARAEWARFSDVVVRAREAREALDQGSRWNSIRLSPGFAAWSENESSSGDSSS